MFKSVEARYALRCFLYGISAALPVLIIDGTWKQILVAGISGSLAYADIGAAVPAVEPSIGKKMGP